MFCMLNKQDLVDVNYLTLSKLSNISPPIWFKVKPPCSPIADNFILFLSIVFVVPDSIVLISKFLI